MKTIQISILAALALAMAASPASAQDGHEGHGHEAIPAEKLGSVHFEISCGAEAQRGFDHAVALLHSFQYEDAERSFAALAASDSSCAMASWGVAMCNYHPIWGPTSQADFERGRAAAERAHKAGGKTDRERAYIGAVASYYQRTEGLEMPGRRAAYEAAMQQLHARFPDDMEGTIFYALAMLGTAPATDRSYAKQREAASLLNAVLPQAPNHPGVAHYLIHSLDYPPLAELALPAARAYSKIAPSSPHAQHMPSHIFTRLGLWDESIRSNLASAEAARQLMARTHPGATHFDALHAMDYLTYAYLQLGQEAKAKQVVDQVRAVTQLDQPLFSAAYAFAAVPARYALERHDWAGAARLTVAPAWFPWKNFPWAEALTQFGRGMGAARSGDVAGARTALARLDTLYQPLVGMKAGYDWAPQVDVQRRALRGWIARAEKRDEDAVTQLCAAADLEDSTDKSPVTPGALLPAREQLADLYTELGRKHEAAEAYQTVLKTSPGRRNSMRGLELVKNAATGAEPSSSRP
jgi:tetratricopeptide (TPR) repeat protein